MRFSRLIAAIVAIGLVLVLVAGAYQAGIVVGAGGAGTAATAPYHWYGPGAWFGPWFGFGLFHLFGFILFVLLIVGLVRLVFWGAWSRPGWGRSGGPRGDWDQRMREYHDSLHANAGTATTTPSDRTATTPPGPGDRPMGG